MDNFNSGWEFKMETDENWRAVAVPHDWLISDTLNLYKSGIGCYRKRCVVGETPRGGKTLLRFDGVYQDSCLFVNGQKVGEWKHGYTAFSHDITKFLSPGENEILLTVRYDSPNTRWYSGAGIYRDTWLIQKNAACFVTDGIYVSTAKTPEGWRVEIDAEIETGGQQCEVRHNLKGLDATPVGDNIFMVKNPRLWDINDPVCYEIESEILANGLRADVQRTRFGFREIAFTPKEGFILNGRRVQLNGVCQHHDLGALGSAVHKDALRRQLLILREMGVNAIRTAHNPPASALMELTDEMGFVVMTELTDMWKRRKTQYDYARFFNEWVVRDVAAWVRRDRNCPSVIMWSVGNEIYDTHADWEDGAATLRFLMEEVRKNDPKRNAPPTLCSNYLPWENTQKCADIIKLVGYNYAEYLYKEHGEKYPDWIIYGGETASNVQSRGIYHFPLKASVLSDDDLQCSALGNSCTSWGKTTESVIISHRDTPGQFLWTGFDYIGEPTPYHTKNSYFGQIDTAGFPKDSFYVYKAAWTTEPVLHLFPYWDWSPGKPVDVRITSNAPVVELFLNGKSLGRKEIDILKGPELCANYIVPYEPGILKAVSYNENGDVISEASRRSFGDAASLVVKTQEIGELVFAEISALDKDGFAVENATNRVNISVKNGELLGLDNGNSTDYDQYQGVNNRMMFSGKLLAIVKANHGEKPVITAEFNKDDIPVRKIEIIRDGFDFTAKIFPKNATYSDIHWRLTDANGIDSPLGTLSVSGDTAKLSPKGDGEVFIRACAKNGKDHIDLIADQPMTITGYGKPFLNPYSFVSAGLYNISNVPMTNGNERGVATLRDGISHVGFKDVDFGDFGSDEVTLWLFPLSHDPFTFEMWRGMPGEGTTLGNFTYDQGSKWNTYKTVTYKLPERLKGIQTFSLAFAQKVHIKGFLFKSKAFDEIPFAACDSIYGDSFEEKERAIEGIGNNVTITFNNMDFERAADSIELRWRSQIDKNTIRLVFVDADGGETVNLLNLPASEDYTSATLPLPSPLSGLGSLNFIFLPGSAIDLEFFRCKSGN